MDITGKRDFDVRVSFTEGEFKAIKHSADVLGFSSVNGFIRFHLSNALISCEEKVSSLNRITGRPVKCPPRASDVKKRA